MQRICHAVTSKFPNLNFIGLCHEIESMRRQLPTLMETELSKEICSLPLSPVMTDEEVIYVIEVVNKW